MTAQTIFLHRTVGEVVAEDYARGAIFKRHGIDFCCGGGITVADACRRRGVEAEALERELRAPVREAGTWADPGAWDLDLLVDHIEKLHHRYVRRTLPVLRQFTTKLARVHGEAHPSLVEVRERVEELASELQSHMADEEERVFPRLVALQAGPPADAGLDDAVQALEDDHARAGAAMARLRELTEGFTAPAGACATWRAAFALLEEFEADLHRHVHLENNVLFPRAAALRTTGAP